VLRRLFLGTIAGAFVAVATSAPRTALAKTKAKVEIVDTSWPSAGTETKARVKSVLRTLRRQASASATHLDFGERAKVRLSLVIKELTLTEEEGLIRISCAVVGKLEGGGTAKSRISMGGKPDQRKKLERDALGATSDSVMVRLAELAKAANRSEKSEKKKPTAA
jgi:hypothetical protein